VTRETRPHAYAHDFGGEPLDVAVQALSFASRTPGFSRMEVYTGYRAADLGYAPADGGWVAVQDVEAVVKTPDYREVARVKRSTRDRKSSVDDLQGRLVLGEVDLRVEPGSYLLAVSVRDSTNRCVGVSQRPVQVRAFPPGELSISDVTVAFDVSPGRPGDPFVKGDLQVAPCPLPVFPRERDLFLYFEIYGLTVSPAGDAYFSLDLLVRPREDAKKSPIQSSKGVLRPGVATSWEGRGRGASAREYVALETGTIRPGTYDLEVKVTDRVGEAVATRTSAVTLGE
jgi:hypothetical protein